LIKRLLDRKYGGDESAVPTVDYLAVAPKAAAGLPAGVIRTESAGAVTYHFGKTLPETSAWLETLGGDRLSWIRALVTSNIIVQGTSYIDNPLRRILAPRAGQKIVVKYTGSTPTSITVYGAARSYGDHIQGFKSLEIIYKKATQGIDVTLFEERQGSSIPLSLQFVYKPSQGFAPIHEISTGRNERIKAFYWKLWYGDDETLPTIDIREKFVGPEVTILAEDVEQFCAVVGNQGESFKTARTEQVQAPMDFAIVTGWQVRYFSFSRESV
jgi:fatty acid synthase subunit beta